MGASHHVRNRDVVLFNKIINTEDNYVTVGEGKSVKVKYFEDLMVNYEGEVKTLVMFNMGYIPKFCSQLWILKMIFVNGWNLRNDDLELVIRNKENEKQKVRFGKIYGSRKEGYVAGCIFEGGWLREEHGDDFMWLYQDA